ncbi:UDP-3-O-acyl-N-acetylglucosamine deacetylase [Roseibium sp. RKSG952]|uniref:UDP-3-O-acyl-N-acetylglucosamine deacetylase n=1 Tax=Roseibium sp. RKSG952 TaxID=2529384 RepID=UPI0018AD1CE2|nr:UDP-3-O-acyl-N-acetylglucosamine deacetylase [Roseibium sp. RKSG952]
MSTNTAQPARLIGIGLHSGERCSVEVAPAAAGAGILLAVCDGPFVRLSDISTTQMPLRTRILVKGVPVDTVEHMMAGLAISRLTDITLRFDGPEVPILDGSAYPWVEFFRKFRLSRNLNLASERLEIVREAVYVFGGSEYILSPGNTAISVEIDYSGTPIGCQSASFVEDEFPLMARARTFCLERDVEQMKKGGLGKGGSLENAVVMGERGPLNPEGLRMNHEFAAHKALDLYGDLFLSGGSLDGSIRARRPGHTSNAKLLSTALKDGTLRLRGHDALEECPRLSA